MSALPTLKQLQYLVALSAHLNFTRAAEQAHITQAGLSILIREMEKQLGCRLFDRTTRMVSLTPAGRRLLPVVERLLTDLGERVRDVAVAPDGAVWVITDEDDGKLVRLSVAS